MVLILSFTFTYYFYLFVLLLEVTFNYIEVRKVDAFWFTSEVPILLTTHWREYRLQHSHWSWIYTLSIPVHTLFESGTFGVACKSNKPSAVAVLNVRHDTYLCQNILQKSTTFYSIIHVNIETTASPFVHCAFINVHVLFQTYGFFLNCILYCYSRMIIFLPTHQLNNLYIRFGCL